MKRVQYFALFLIVIAFVSCVSSKGTTTLSNGTDITKYKYILFGKENDGDEELADILLMVQSELSEKLTVVSDAKAIQLIAQGEYVLSPRINVKTEKWGGGHTYISISFFDADTNQNVAVVKSSGIGLSISHDQQLAFKAIKKELDKVFK